MQENFLEKYRKIGRRIAFYRNKRGLSQEALGEKINYSKSYISKIEASNSDVTYSLDILFAIAAGLQLDPVIFLLPINEENFDKYRTDK
ncbi:helix-turn-helix domain-containing protein [Sporomusa acidovorans]|uniref:HTH cro/C1-type domain-containing protein n=1 Tax=Sporomusa acidovorans (strain ATCC 49682 / DSM 3132 / Mol) TaxID=1123286 RepID=A0ABZ3JAM6_SPOA4|nr:helix-turn-helix transcriptional regulator [Sporomusa acidovorans]OZC17326.1 helix-turn-helix protein [Sporomusa acidovorans DSM 3132]SDF45110.1 Helix-turn-helix [Sporomusa acidovorans]